MSETPWLEILAFIALFLMALITGVSFSHLLQRSPKAELPGPQFLAIQQILLRNYGAVIGALEVTALLLAGLLAVLVRARPALFYLAAGAATCLALMIAIWAVLSLRYFGRPYPTAVRVYLIAIYGLLLVGEFRAWWKPYLFGADPKLVQRYEAMFGKTHAFLPKRSGIVPNTAHVVLHACTLLAFLVALSVGK
jgi:hypothetical protein